MSPADPLRVLRAVRFAARFGFTLDTQILEAGSSEPVSLHPCREWGCFVEGMGLEVGGWGGNGC